MNVRILFSLRLWATALVLVGCVGGQGAAPESKPVYWHHSVGAARFTRLEEGTRFREIWQHPTSKELRKQVIQSVAQIPLKSFASTVSSNQWVEAKSHLVGLLGDVVEYETVLDVRGEQGSEEWVLAIQVPPGRRHAWTNQLFQVLEPLKFAKPEVVRWNGWSGFESKGNARALRAGQVGEWTLLGLSKGALTAWDGLAARIRKDQAPALPMKEHWLEIDADLAQLRKTFTMIPEFADSKLHWTWAGKGEYVRTVAKLKFPKSLGYQTEEWNMPLGLISEPLVSFTAARGIAPLLLRSAEVQSLGLQKDVPNQAVGWALGRAPFFTYTAFPRSGTSNFLAAHLDKLPMVMTNHGRAVGQLLWVTNRAQAIWNGLPVLKPFLASFKDVHQEFLLAGLIPPPFAKDPAPEALLKQVKDRPQLAYYDWEITEERLATWRRVYLVGLMAFGRQPPATNAPSNLFLNEVSKGQKLGNSITEVMVTSDDELTFTRTSHLGFTGFELLNLLRWMDSSGFPFTYESAPGYAFDLNKRPPAAKPANPGGRSAAPGNMKMHPGTMPGTSPGSKTNRVTTPIKPAVPKAPVTPAVRPAQPSPATPTPPAVQPK